MKYQIKYRELTLIITGILLGFLMALQARSFGNFQNSVSRDNTANVFQEIQVLKTTNENLSVEINALQDQLSKASNQEQAVKAIQDEINNDKMVAGEIAVSGSGIEVMIKNDLQAIWLTDIVNEMWSAGAEAVSVNTIRLTNTTVGFDTLPNGQIALNGVILTAPYHFDAIGDKKTLSEALNQTGGIIQRINESMPNTDITLTQKDLIQMDKVL